MRRAAAARCAFPGRLLGRRLRGPVVSPGSGPASAASTLLAAGFPRKQLLCGFFISFFSQTLLEHVAPIACVRCCRSDTGSVRPFVTHWDTERRRFWVSCGGYRPQPPPLPVLKPAGSGQRCLGHIWRSSREGNNPEEGFLSRDLPALLDLCAVTEFSIKS